LEELLTITVSTFFCFVDIGGIVDYHCLVNNSTNIKKTKERLNSDGQQFHQYQQNRENLNSDGQQFHQYQQNRENLNSDGRQFHQYQVFFCFVDIGGIVDHHCLNFLLFS
jgi:hypothetical protein